MYEECGVKNYMVWYGYREIMHKYGLVNAKKAHTKRMCQTL